MMMRFLFWLLTAGTILSAGTSCSPWTRMAKKGTIAQKDSAAMHFYEHRQFDRAVYLFEEIKPFYSGEPRYHDIYFYHVDCLYKLGDLSGAMMYYEDYVNKYPGSKYAADFTYMGAYSTYLMSDDYELDQTYTYAAIEKFQLFLGKYPNSEHVADCEKYIRELIEKLGEKAFQQASLYLKTGHYKAAVQGFQNMLDEHPDSKRREEASWLQYQSSVKLARSSVDLRKRVRYEESFEYFKKFSTKYPGGTYAKEAQTLNEVSKKEYERFLVEQKVRDENKAYLEFKAAATAAFETTRDDEFDAAYKKALNAWSKVTEMNPDSKFLDKGRKTYDKLIARKKGS